jgi:hypothetical protein
MGIMDYMANDIGMEQNIVLTESRNAEEPGSKRKEELE